MQNGKKTAFTTERFKEPRESDVFVLCPIVWSGDCGCVTPRPPTTACMRAEQNAPVTLGLAFDTPTPHLRGGGAGR